MTEDFVNSGWKDKKLWQPPQPEPKNKAAPPGSNSADGKGVGPRSRLRGEGARVGSGGIAGALGNSGAGGHALEEASDDGELLDAPVGAGDKRPPQRNKKAQALDPESGSSSDESTRSFAAECALAELTIPRTALVYNISMALKRLNGCCSLNQLTKQVKTFKEKNGVTLEAFLRANPMSFKLEGRIVYLMDHGEKWKPPPGQKAKGGKDDDKGGKGGEKGGKNGATKGGASAGKNGASSKGHAGKNGGKDDYSGWYEGYDYDQQWSASGGGTNSKPRRGKRGGGGGAANADDEWYGYDWEGGYNDGWGGGYDTSKSNKWRESDGWGSGW